MQLIDTVCERLQMIQSLKTTLPKVEIHTFNDAPSQTDFVIQGVSLTCIVYTTFSLPPVFDSAI